MSAGRERADESAARRIRRRRKVKWYRRSVIRTGLGLVYFRGIDRDKG